MTVMKAFIGKRVAVSGVLVVGLIISCIAMQAAFNSGDQKLTRILGVCCGILCIGSSLSIGLQAVRHVEHKRLKTKSKYERIANIHQNYCARYSIKNRVILSLLTSVTAFFTCITYAHQGYYPAKIIALAVLFFWTTMLYRHLFTSVWFTENIIVFEVKFFTKLSKSYEAVTAMRAKQGNLQIEFSDGKTLNLPSGLGDLTEIAHILEKRVKVTPIWG